MKTFSLSRLYMPFIGLYRAALLIALCFALILSPAVGHAATTTNRGLLISPLRDYVNVDAGGQKTQNFTVANLTEKPINVALSVKQFSVSDYAYDYQFSEPHDSWVRLTKTEVQLKPNESQKISYQLSVPAKNAPGGYYYTLFASANLSGTGLSGTVQAASLLYITVNGKLIQTNSLQSSSMSHIVFGKQIPYSLNVRNSGNVHYFGYFSTKVQGLFTNISPTGTSHLLLPGTTRRIGNSVPAPLLPGIYKVTYGYQPESGAAQTRSQYILNLPPWSIAAVILLIFFALRLHRKKTPQQTPSTTQS